MCHGDAKVGAKRESNNADVKINILIESHRIPTGQEALECYTHYSNQVFRLISMLVPEFVG
jgi:hypothetical protein